MLTITLKDIKEFLLTITPNSFHHEATKQTNEYIVWAEDSEREAVHADDKKEQQILDVTIDVFTKEEYSKLVETLQKEFNEKGIPFKLLSTQYEADTTYTHYEYLIQAVIDIG